MLCECSTHRCYPPKSNDCELACAQNMYYQQQTTKLEAMGPMPIDPGPDLVCRMAARSFAQVVRAPHTRAVQIHAWVAGCGCEEVMHHTGLRCTALAEDAARCRRRVCAGTRDVHEGPEEREEQGRGHHGLDEDAGRCSLERLLRRGVPPQPMPSGQCISRELN